MLYVVHNHVTDLSVACSCTTQKLSSVLVKSSALDLVMVKA